MHHRRLLLGVLAVGSAGCSAASLSCPTGRTPLDGVCVDYTIADFAACIRARGATLGEERGQKLAAEAAYLGSKASATRDVDEKLVKQYSSPSTPGELAIIQQCGVVFGLRPASQTSAAPAPSGAPAPSAAPDPPRQSVQPVLHPQDVELARELADVALSALRASAQVVGTAARPADPPNVRPWSMVGPWMRGTIQPYSTTERAFSFEAGRCYFIVAVSKAEQFDLGLRPSNPPIFVPAPVPVASSPGDKTLSPQALLRGPGTCLRAVSSGSAVIVLWSTRSSGDVVYGVWAQ